MADDINLLDPHGPNIHDLFVHFRDLYFHGGLGGVSVEWSSRRMTSCGGTCQKVPGGAIIKLSYPLLSLRPPSDTMMVLLHEMIHAHCMVNNIKDPDPSGHGPPFRQIMHSINSSTIPDSQRPPGGYNIAVYHTMLDEVEFYRQHHWQCNRCGNIIKRAMNRMPQPADCLHYRKSKKEDGEKGCGDARCQWHLHVRFCGGEYVKIKEPVVQNTNKGNTSSNNSSSDARSAKKHKTAVVDKDGFKAQHKEKSTHAEHQTSLDQYVQRKAVISDNNKDSSILPAITNVLAHQNAHINHHHNNNKNNSNNKPASTAQAKRSLLEAAALRRQQQADTSIQRERQIENERSDITCPVCYQNLGGVSEREATVHVNQCLTIKIR